MVRVLADLLAVPPATGEEPPEACAEVGRQPWVVYHVMRTSAAVTGAAGVQVGYATLIAVYLALAAGVAWVLLRLYRAPLDGERPAAPPLTGRS